MRWALLLVALAACGHKDASKSEVAACDNMAKVCSDTWSSGDRDKCVGGWGEFHEKYGDATTAKFASCATDAKSCDEVKGCMVGAMGNRAEQMAKEVSKGMDKMAGTNAAEEALPPECARVNEVCAPDEPFARKQCREMVSNLKSDPQNLNELTTCIAAAQNCYALKKCRDDRWFKLQR
jgi:hypothetical protein